MDDSVQPLGKVFTELAKSYAGSFVERLSHLPINRYYYALVVIARTKGEMNQTDLASELYVDKATLVRMLDYLEGEGCLVRETNPRDRRAHMLKLTAKAEAMIPEIIEAIASTNAGMAKQAELLGVADFEKVMQLLMQDFQSKSFPEYSIQYIRKDEN